MTITSAAVLLLLVLDPFGGIPLFIAVLRRVNETQRARVILRECAIAFLVLLIFLLGGKHLLDFLQLSQPSLGIAGGVILFLIAIRIVFPTRQGVFGDLPEGEPFIVPLAVPTLAGPSSIATILLLVSRWPERMVEWFVAMTAALLVSTAILYAGNRIARLLGERGIMALERLMGLILTALAVEMFLNGLKEFIQHL